MVFSSVLFYREVCPPKPQVCSTWQVLSQVLCEMFSIDLKQWIYEKDCWVIAASIGLRGNSISRKYVASKDWTPWTNVSKMCRCSAITVTDLLQRCMCFCLFDGGHVTPTTHTHPSISSCLPIFYEVFEFGWILRMPKAETLEDAHVIQALAKVEQQWGALADYAQGRVTGAPFLVVGACNHAQQV